MPDINRDVSIEQVDYTIDVNNVEYSIEINPQNTYAIELNEQGPQGATGPQGETGNGISSIVQTGTVGLDDTYTIYYTNGDTYNFTVTNGEDGTDGVDGQDGADGTNATIVGATASITGTTGTPGVTVTMGGTESARTFDFAFSNLKGDKGDQGIQGSTGASGTNAEIVGVTASVDSNVGTPSVSVSMGGTESSRTFDFQFHNLKGADGMGSVDSVNGQTGTVVLTATDVGALSDTVTIPTTTSELVNDSGFVTASALATVATTGSYSDLIGTPTIGSGNTTITVDGTAVGTINANATSDSTIDIQGGLSRNIGEVVVSTIPLTDAGLHLLDGTLISGSGSYADFVTYISGLVSTYPDLFETEANWQTAVTTYGVCGKFVYDSVNNTVRLPKYSNKIYTDAFSSDTPVVGNGKALGLSNGTFNDGTIYGASVGGANNIARLSASGAGTDAGSSYSYTSFTDGKKIGVSTDPDKSGLIAQLSNITTSLDGYYYIVVATSSKTDIQVDIDEIATDLNGKADVDLTNLSTTGKANGVHLAMPSSSYITFSLGASGARYQAPADGWMTCMLNNLTSLQLYCGDLQSFAHSTNATYLACTLPIKKGTNAVIYYGGGTPTYIKVWFVYAEGTKV